VSGDTVQVSELGNQLLNAIDEIDGDQRWRVYIRDNPMIEAVNFKDKSALTVPFDPEELDPSPVDMHTIPTQYLERFTWLNRFTSQVNGFNRVWNTFLRIMLVGGRKMLKSPIMQWYKGYLRTFDSEPFKEFGSGTVNVTGWDSAVTLRTKLTMNCLWWQSQGTKPQLVPIIEELWKWFFMNPAVNTLKMKKMKFPFIQMLFAASTAGERPKWNNPDLESCRVETVFTCNDLPALIVQQKDIDEATILFKKEKLFKTLAMLQELVYGDQDQENMSTASFAVFLEALTGFYRSDYPRRFAQDAAENLKREAKDTTPMEPRLKKLWAQFFSDVKPMTKRQFEASIPTEMTTRSAGLFEDDVPVIVTEITVAGRVEKVMMKANDKSMLFHYNPDLAMSKELFDEAYSEKRPGRIFYRHVPARADRPVEGGVMPVYIGEISIARDLQRWLSQQSRGGKPLFTVGVDTGNFLTDHGRWGYATSTCEELILLLDFSSFDSTEQDWNVRKPMITEALRRGQVPGSEVIYMGMNQYELMAEIWKKTIHARYSIRDSIDTNLMIVFNQLLSGEFNTININNMTHWAFLEVYLDALARSHLSDYVRWNESRLQGDDEITMLAKTGSFKMLDDEGKAKVIRELTDLIADTAEACGLVIGRAKTISRVGLAEFLKKMFVFGCIVPRISQLQMNEAERVDRGQDPLTRLRARIGQWREWIWRGGDYVVAIKSMYFEICLSRVAKGMRRSARLPMEITWVPQRFGGLGILPQSIIDPNMDLMIETFQFPDRTKLVMDAYISAYQRVRVNTVNDVVNQLAPLFEKGVEWTKAHDDRERYLLSESATKHLKDRFNVDVSRTAYYNRHEEVIKQMLGDNPKVTKKWATQDKIEKAIGVVELASEIIKSGETPNEWRRPEIMGISFEEVGVVDYALPMNVVAGLDPFLQQWLMQIGTSAKLSAHLTKVFDAFRQVTEDPIFPKNLKWARPEAIANTLLSKGLVGSEEILAYLVSLGGDPQRSANVAQRVAGELSALSFINSITQFSQAGEGFSNRTQSRVFELVEVPPPFDGATAPLAKLIYALGFQYMRTRPIFEVVGDKMVYRTRQRVRVNVSDDTLKVWLASQGKAAALEAINFYEAMFDSD
jgi:hypothetical protein